LISLQPGKIVSLKVTGLGRVAFFCLFVFNLLFHLLRLDLFSTFVIAVGPAMAAFAVSVTSGVTIKAMLLRQTGVITFSFLNVTIFTPAMILSVATFILSCAGIIIGPNSGHLFEGKIEIVGGVVLILIGFKILLEHTLFQAA
jgi:putative Mn2+ efflux pump MntP